MARLDQLLAVYEFFGGASSSLSAPASVGDTTIQTVASFAAGQVIELDPAAAPAEDAYVLAVTGTGPYTLTLQAPLGQPHASGAVVTTYQTSPTGIAGLLTVCRGQPFDLLDEQLPAMVITIPDAEEHRFKGQSVIKGMAQFKSIDYTVRMMVGALLEGGGGSPTNAPGLLVQFYRLLDEISALIRTNKILSVPSYPSGASVRFGEDITSPEVHERQEDTLKAIAKMETVSTELVHA